MLVDSHCHLDRIDLAPYNHCFSEFMEAAGQQGIEHLLSIAIDLESYPAMLELVKDYSQISVTVGVHPNENDGREPSIDDLIHLGQVWQGCGELAKPAWIISAVKAIWNGRNSASERI